MYHAILTFLQYSYISWTTADGNVLIDDPMHAMRMQLTNKEKILTILIIISNNYNIIVVDVIDHNATVLKTI